MGSGARFRPSKADQFMRCPVSVPRSEAVVAEQGEEEAGPAAQWGTDSHAMLQKGFDWGMPPTALAPGDQTSQEKAECADIAYNYITAAADYLQPSVLRSEIQVDPGKNTRYEGLGAGTTDILLITQTLLAIYDYKTGRHVVEPDSYQVMMYLLGAVVEYWPDRSQSFPFETLVTGIIQPRAPHKQGTVRTKQITLEELLEFEKRMYAAMDAADDPASIGIPGEEQCRYCPAKSICPEHARWQTAQILNPVGIPVPPSIDAALQQAVSEGRHHNLDASVLSEMLSMRASIEAWMQTLEDEVRRRLEQREPVPGWALARAKSRPKWKHDKEVTRRKLLNIKGVLKKMYMKDALMTPLQVMSAIPEEHKEAVEKLWERPEGGIIVVPDTDPRPDPLAWMDTIQKTEEN